ncbi:MAG: hypothetical protein E7A62_06315 [Actinomycetaceae bacterium]|nr:hypothetical protein [Actinomycetaceae bacterium]MDU0970594.1 hypothetical protein [Actinomycetaceae bacterium]
MEVGSLADWFGAVGTITTGAAAVLAAVKANQAADKANALAEQADEQAKKRHDEALEREEKLAEENREHEDRLTREKIEHEEQINLERRYLDMASHLQAWWATTPTPGTGPDIWGIIARNEAGGCYTFRNVTIYTTHKNNSSRELQISVLPPGTYFYESKSNGGWASATPLDSLAGFQPVHTFKPYWTIHRIRFTDPTGTCWQWDQNGFTAL